MAITATDRGSAFGTSVSSLSSASFTPAANSMLIVSMVGSFTNTSSNSVAGHALGSAWVKIGNYHDWGTANRDFELWASFSGASPAADTVDVSFGGIIGGANCYFVEIGGDVDTSGSVANAFGVTNQVAGYDLRAETLTLAAFAAATNMTFAVAAKSGAAAPTWTDGTFTTFTATNGGGLMHQVAYLASEDNSVAVTFSNYSYNLMYAVEIKAAAAAAGRASHFMGFGGRMIG